MPWFDLNWKTHGWIWHWLTGNHFLGVHLCPFVHSHQVVDGSQGLDPSKLISYTCVDSSSKGYISIGRDWLGWISKPRWIKHFWIFKYVIVHMSSIGDPKHLKKQTCEHHCIGELVILIIMVIRKDTFHLKKINFSVYIKYYKSKNIQTVMLFKILNDIIVSILLDL